jgi:Acyl-CoA dehydrogenase, C-terminal domain
MDLLIPEDVEDFGQVARQTLADQNLDRARAIMAGDDETSRRALEQIYALGLADLDLSDHHDALAAAFLAIEVGRVAAPVGVASLVTARAAKRDGLLQAVGRVGQVVLVNYGEGEDQVAVIALDGSICDVQSAEAAAARPILAPYSCLMRPDTAAEKGQPWHWALHQTLESFVGLGSAEAAIDISRTHLQNRHQFGKALKEFQALQHRFVDCMAHAAGLRELALFTLWRLYAHPETAILDALALRFHHIEVVRAIYKSAHQFHAAIGFCDEHPLSVLTRSVRFCEYSPLTLDETAQAVVEHIGDGWDAPFVLR